MGNLDPSKQQVEIVAGHVYDCPNCGQEHVEFMCPYCQARGVQYAVTPGFSMPWCTVCNRDVGVFV